MVRCSAGSTCPLKGQQLQFWCQLVVVYIYTVKQWPMTLRVRITNTAIHGSVMITKFLSVDKDVVQCSDTCVKWQLNCLCRVQLLCLTATPVPCCAGLLTLCVFHPACHSHHCVLCHPCFKLWLYKANCGFIRGKRPVGTRWRWCYAYKTALRHIDAAMKNSLSVFSDNSWNRFVILRKLTSVKWTISDHSFYCRLQWDIYV